MRQRRTRLIAAMLIALVATTAYAQRFGRFGRLAEGPGVPVRYPPPQFADGSFYVCKLEYTSVRYEDQGVGWSTDYPYAGINLMTRLDELTRTPISRGGTNTWENVVTSCSPCNNRKGNQVPEEVGMRLLTAPAEPNYVHLVWAVRRVTPIQARWIGMFYGEETVSLLSSQRAAG